MLDSFLTVAQQVLVLFLLIGIGFVLGKMHVLNQAAVKSCTDMVLLIISPCIIIQSFMRDFDAKMLGGFGIAALAALIVQLGSILIAHLVFRDKNDARRRVLRFATVFSNSGYMAIPLQQALLGDIGVFYGASFINVFNLVLWSYGLMEMSGDKQSLSSRKSIFKLFINPGTVGLLIGMLLFLFSVHLPNVIVITVNHLAALNTPLPMIIVGYYLSNSNLLAALKDKRSYTAIALRLLFIPLLTFGCMLLFGIKGPILVSCVVATSAPVAAVTTMFSTKYHQDTELSVNLVSLSTLFSMITMPLVVGMAQSVS